MSERKNELNQILLRIVGAALFNNFEEVGILIRDASTKLENGRAELDEETVEQLQSSLASISRLARDMRNIPVNSGYKADRPKTENLLRRLGPEGCVERWSTAVHRRRYSVPTPNHLWHMDGNMKLIRWGFATHGCIDGFSRFITFLRCGINNTASTVLQLFVFACCSYGVPSRVRSDHGGENTKVALFMNLIRQRTSHITGKSVHNQRIERLWRDMYTQVTSKFYNEFCQMEEDPVINLDPDNMIHRSALQYVYLPAINRSLEEFRNGWNGHKIRSEGHMSPSQIWMSGMLDNMSSGYTPTSELFGVNPSIGDRLDSGLQRFGLTLDDVH
ncbi:uncharacterized protein LOC127701866 [Mytilus californianus]|uniref:uncharacterized protein LOC127701866 n=1 Tax=Mytilus californianus TaxID=6549 RepID=UPI0022478399|nr:uncharacterized protein LOC127701866 [Mytilus californianus]